MDSDLFDYLELDRLQAAGGRKILLADGQRQLTGFEIHQKVFSIGKYLMEAGYYRQPIAVIAGHNVDTVLCFLGILASGNHYIPLDPYIRTERFEKIQKLAGFHLLITCGQSDERFQKQKIEKDVRPVTSLAVEKTQKLQIQTEDIEKLAECRRRLSMDEPAYFIFTSGSTGEPKGIIKTHKGMINFLDAYIQEFGFRESDRIGNQTPFYFDASAKDLYLALKQKCQMYILEEKWFVRPLQLAEYMKKKRITVIQWVPSALSILSRFRVFKQVSLPDLRLVLSVGEVFPVNQLRVWMEMVPDAQYINLYGSSEIAGICAYYRIHALEDGQDLIPIGYALKNCEIYLVDGDKLITEPNQIGEMYVRSQAVAAGYLLEKENGAAGQLEGTFRDRPLPQLPQGNYYCSGDLAYYGNNGELFFSTRKDSQVKHMGHRIELGEITSAAQAMEQVQNSCCVYEKHKLILFFKGSCGKADLARFLKDRLAPYQIPNKLVKLDVWPLNANGKTDQVRLKQLAVLRRNGQ